MKFDVLVRGKIVITMNPNFVFWTTFLLTINEIVGGPARAHPYSAEEYCRDLEPQKSMDLDQMMGLWYAVEVVEHRPNVPRSGQGTTIIDSCPVLHLAQTSAHSVRLVWSEKAGQIDYRFSIPESDSPGYWVSTGPQNVSGTGQVLKVVHDHMVLSICLAPPNSQQFSVLMSRDQQLKAREIQSVNNLLVRKRLPLHNIRQGCSAAVTAGSMVFSTNYQQFAGTVQVIKLQPSHAIITFCSPNSQKFSVVLAREHHLPRAQLRGLNIFIQKKNLTLEEIKEACRNAGSSVIPGYSVFIVILVTLFLILIWRVCSD